MPPRFPVELQSLLSVAVAALDAQGALIEANDGFLKLVGLHAPQAFGTSIARFFIQPNFSALSSAREGADAGADDDSDVHRGLLTIGEPMGRIRSLRGRVWRVGPELRVLAEYDIDELGRLYDTVIELNTEYAAAQLELAQTNVKLRQREAEIVALSLTDPLTGVGNRRRLEQALAVEIKRGDRTQEKLCALVADLDHFKRVNDTHGHEAGDRVLAAFGDILRRCTRVTDIVARWGGEEFVVLMPHTDRDNGSVVAERLRAEIAAARIAPLPGPVTVSVGLVERAAGEQGESLLRRADKALYDAKTLGRNRVVVG